jgi:hypothetical protein
MDFCIEEGMGDGCWVCGDLVEDGLSWAHMEGWGRW